MQWLVGNILNIRLHAQTLLMLTNREVSGEYKGKEGCSSVATTWMRSLLLTSHRHVHARQTDSITV